MKNLCPKEIKAAFYVECQNAAFKATQNVEEIQDMTLNKVPLGRPMARYEDGSTIISGRAKQAAGRFSPLGKSSVANKPLVPGELPGRNCADKTAFFNTNILDMDEGACEEKRCNFSIGQGWRTRGYDDYKYSYETDVICIKDLEQIPEAQAKEYFMQLVEDFRLHGENTYRMSIRDLSILNSEANGTVLSPNNLHLAAGGFFAPPQSRITIHYLIEYRLHMVRIGALGRNERLVVSGPEQDYIDAYTEHMARRYASNGLTAAAAAYMEAMLFDDKEQRMKGARYYDFDMIRWVVNEDPPRGYFKPDGTTPSGQVLYQWVDIEPWINEVQEAGLVAVPNPDYGKEYVVCGGVKYPVVTLLEALNAKQFSRHPLKEPVDMAGRGATDKTTHDFSLNIVDGAYLDCNEDNWKFKLTSTRRFRWRNIWNEYGGFIAYLHHRPCGYVLSPCEKTCDNATPAFATVRDGDNCDDFQGSCCAPAGIDPGTLSMTPCGAVTTVYTGESAQVTLTVTRAGGSTGAASVDYTFADDTALNGTHYNGTNGTLSWADGEYGNREITVEIVGGDANAALDFAVTLSNVSGATLESCVTTTVSIESCDTVAGCAGCGNPTPVE